MNFVLNFFATEPNLPTAYLTLDHGDYSTDKAAARGHSPVPVDPHSGVYVGPDKKADTADMIEDKKVAKYDLVEDDQVLNVNKIEDRRVYEDSLTKTKKETVEDAVVRRDVKDPRRVGKHCLADLPSCQDRQDSSPTIVRNSGRTEWF